MDASRNSAGGIHVFHPKSLVIIVIQMIEYKISNRKALHIIPFISIKRFTFRIMYDIIDSWKTL